MKVIGNVSIALNENRELCIKDGDNFIVISHNQIKRFVNACDEIAQSASSFSEPAKRIFNHWLCVMNKGPATKYTTKRRNKILARLREGYTEDYIKQAVNGCYLTPHNMGDNANGVQYNDIELICRDGCYVERFFNTANKIPSKTVKTTTTYENLTDRSWANPEGKSHERNNYIEPLHQSNTYNQEEDFNLLSIEKNV